MGVRKLIFCIARTNMKMFTGQILELFFNYSTLMQQDFLHSQSKLLQIALADVSQWTEHQPVN